MEIFLFHKVFTGTYHCLSVLMCLCLFLVMDSVAPVTKEEELLYEKILFDPQLLKQEAGQVSHLRVRKIAKGIIVIIFRE
jgi:hypothetical protein